MRFSAGIKGRAAALLKSLTQVSEEAGAAVVVLGVSVGERMRPGAPSRGQGQEPVGIRSCI